MIDFSMRQIRIPTNLYNAIKKYCKKNKINLTEFYDKMIAWFITQEYDEFYASYKNGKIISLRISRTHLKEIVAHAKKANVSDARVVYSALLIYSEHIGIFKLNA